LGHRRRIACGEKGTELLHLDAPIPVEGVGRICAIGPIVRHDASSIPGDRGDGAIAVPCGFPDEPRGLEVEIDGLSHLENTHYSFQKKDLSSPGAEPYFFTFMGLAIGSGKSMISLR
jgi:hypothetical protein